MRRARGGLILGLDAVTDRHRAVLLRLMFGRGYKGAAGDLGIPLATVRNLVSELLAATGARSITHLAAHVAWLYTLAERSEL